MNTLENIKTTEEIADHALTFLSTRYKHNNFKFIKLVDIPQLPNLVPWLCVIEDSEKKVQRLVTIQDNEWQTMTFSVLTGIQNQLNQALKEVKTILKKG